MPEIAINQWDDFIVAHPESHILQSSAWGRLKADFGWQVTWVLAGNSGAQILFRNLPLGFSVAYIPRGPLGEAGEDFWAEVDRVCQQHGSVFLKMEPDMWQNGETRIPAPAGFVHSLQAIQPPRTLVVSLDGDDASILARMKQKTRYNVRLALRRDIIARPTGDLDLFYRLMHETGARDGFGVHAPSYYQRAYELFYPHGQCEIFVAELRGEPLAALMVFAKGSRAWYFYGASTNKHRERMPTYLLQWEAMRWAKAQGCVEYDLWGVPDASLEELESQFTGRSDGLWGVYRFKRGFGGELRRTAGPWDRVYRPALYRLYRWWYQLRKGNG